MSDNGSGVKTVVSVSERNALDEYANAHGDDSHLQVIISQEAYDAIQEVVERATARGLESSFDYWLEKCAISGAQAKTRTWDDRDVVTLMTQAKRGNAGAIAKLRKMFPNL